MTALHNVQLNYWAEQFGLDELRPDAMAPWFDGREERHSMAPWQVDPNVNNDILRQGCEKLGYSWQIIPRNVNGCWNLGYSHLRRDSLQPPRATLPRLAASKSSRQSETVRGARSMDGRGRHWRQQTLGE